MEEQVEQRSRILDAVPNSRILFKSRAYSDAETRSGLVAMFEANGITGGRILCEGASPHGDLLARYGAVDIALDPFPYCGGITTCEALWMGVPVVTLTGNIPQGRHSTSHLINAGLDEFVSATPDAYVETAVAWATDLDRLAAMRAGLRDRMAASPLCDCAGFAAALADAYRHMWRRWCDAAGAR